MAHILYNFNSTLGCSPIMCKFIAPCTKCNPWTRLRPMPFSPTTQNAFNYARFTYTKSAEGTFTTIIAFQYVFEVFDCNVMHNVYIHLNKFHLSKPEGEREGRKVTEEENNALKCISKIRARIKYMTNEGSALRKYGIRANSIRLYVTILSSKLKNVGRRPKSIDRKFSTCI